MVRLKVIYDLKELPFWLFQFQYGTIKSVPQLNDLRRKSSFNSNMVRLKEPLDIFYFAGKILFQFQYGTIKRSLRPLPLYPQMCFNSNMVRLKVVGGFGISSGIGFQFQYGTIKRLIFFIGVCCIGWIVSIPIWYD